MSQLFLSVSCCAFFILCICGATKDSVSREAGGSEADMEGLVEDVVATADVTGTLVLTGKEDEKVTDAVMDADDVVEAEVTGV